MHTHTHTHTHRHTHTRTHTRIHACVCSLVHAFRAYNFGSKMTEPPAAVGDALPEFGCPSDEKEEEHLVRISRLD